MNLGKIIKKYYPFIILFFLVLFFNIFMNIKQGDFIWFLDKAKTTNLFDYLGNRYFVWTSRIIIEFVLVGVLKLNYTIVFKVINTLVLFFIPCVLLKLFSKKKDIKTQIIIILLFLCYNFKHMSSAGWYATLINYMWPLLCLLVGMIPIKNYVDRKQEKWYINVLYILNIIFACNQEQSCAILFGVYLLFFIYTILNKKISKFSIISLAISSASLIFILTCPGNAARSMSETVTNYPEFASFDFIQKLGLGFSTLLTEYIVNYNFILFTLCLILVIIIFKKYRNKTIVKIISLIPVLLLLIFNYLFRFVLKIVPSVNYIRSIFLEENIMRYVFYKPKILLVAGLSVILLFIISYILIKALKDKEKYNIKTLLEKYYVLIIFLIGVASRLIIGFSSSIFESGFRTNIFFDFSIIIVIIILINKFEKYFKIEEKYIIIILSIVSALNLYSIFISL